MEKIHKKKQENETSKMYMMLQAVVAIVSAVMLIAGSFYFEKYTEELFTSLIVSLILGAVYVKTLKRYVKQFKEIILIHVIMMLMITIGFLMDGFIKPVSFGAILLGIFFSPEIGMISSVFYSVTAVLYTMESGEILMLYLLTAAVGIYGLRDFLQSKQVGLKIGGVVLLFGVQTIFSALFGYYMYRDFQIGTSLVGASFLSVLVLIGEILLSRFLPVARKEIINSSNPTSSVKTAVVEEKKEEKKIDSQKAQKELLAQLKQDKILYQHSTTVAKIAEKVAASIDADTVLVKTGALYHDIGKLANGEDYITDGIELCKRAKFSKEVIQIIQEHNVNYQIPSSKESAIVMLTDTVVSTIEFNQKKGKDTDLNSLIDRIFQVRQEKGALSKCGLTGIELELMKQTMQKEVTL